MSRKLPPHVTRERTRHGKVVFYFRRGKGKRIRLPSIIDPGFEAAYQEQLTGEKPKPRVRGVSGSLEWLIARYRESSAYTALSDATRRQRDNIFKGVVEAAGTARYEHVTRKHIIEGREARAATPAQARNFLDAMRGLFRWALDTEQVETDPTAGVRNPPRRKGPGFEIWLESEVDAYRDRWPLGTHERVWLEVVIGTGSRRGDAVIIGRQHVRNGMIAVETQKEGVWAYVPILPATAQAIATGPTGDLTFIVGKTDRNFTKESFGNAFRTACRAAGVRKSAHGLRKYAATAYAEAGLSDAELESIFGWVRGSAMAAHYSRNAERQKIAQGAAERLGNAYARTHDGGAGKDAKNLAISIAKK